MNGGIKVCPVVDVGNFFGFHINTAVGHGYAKIIVPIGSVNTVAGLFSNLVVVKEKDVRDVG